MLELSNHFIHNWRRRVGGEPRPEAIQAMIRQAVRVQKGRRLSGRFGGWIKTLTIYWHRELDLIITTDHYNGKVVSVYSKDMDRNPNIGDVLGGC